MKATSVGNISKVFFALLVIGGTILPATAPGAERHEIAPDLSFGGSLRLRGETKEQFDFDDGSQDYFLTQLRLNLLWEPSDWLAAYIEGQDARVFGAEDDGVPPIDKDAVPNIYADSIDLHQGYIDLMGGSEQLPMRLRTGRQKLKFGHERLVGPLEWVNTARVWDAVRFTAGNVNERTLDVFISRLVAPDNDNLNDWAKTGSRPFNSDFHGFYLTDWQVIPETQWELYYLLRREKSVFDDEVHTVGTRFETNLAPWDFDGEFAYQFGDYFVNGETLDHDAYAFHIGTGYTVESLNKSRFGAAYNFGSGDDDPSDGDHGTFDNLFPTNHRHYGYMDFFSLQNMHNLELTAQTKAWEKLSLRLAYQTFWLAEEDTDDWYNAAGGTIRPRQPPSSVRDVDPYVGSEIDITAKYPFQYGNLNFAVEGGYSHFFAGDFVEDTGPDDDADFAYLQAKVSF